MDKNEILLAAGIDEGVLRQLQVNNATPLSVRFDFSVPAAQRFSDLVGIRMDLEAVSRICTRLIAEKERRVAQPGDDPSVASDGLFFSDALYAAAVVRLMRTHSSGARYGIPDAWINDLPSELRDVYDYVKAYRDKFIAHAVAPLEDNQVFVCVQVSDDHPGVITQVTIDHGRVMSGGGLEAFALMQLAKALHRRVESEVEMEAAQVLEAARAIPIEDIVKRGSEPVPIPSPDSVSKGRKKFTSGK